jgi:antitoxin VapB
MAVLIKDPETERLVRELAARTGETLTDSVRHAVAARLEQLPAVRKKVVDRAAIDAMLQRLWSRPRINEHLTDDEILGYDEHGLPS